MSILLANAIEKSWADRLVLRGCDLRLASRDRVGLVGSNGCGKSTLLQVLSGATEPDAGDLSIRGSVAALAQQPVLQGETVAEASAQAVAWHSALLADYEAALAADLSARAGALQDQLDVRGWSVDHLLSSILDRVGAPAPEARIETLSGGEQRRLALACTLLEQPDILLLDEPTNHLDADAVEWLQSYLLGYRGAVLLVTHDRYLLEAVADRIVEIDGGQSTSYDGSYGDYLVARAERRARLSQQRDRRLRLIATEAAWAARSPSARTTKQKGRLKRLEALRESVPEIEDRSYQFRFASGIHKGSTLLQIRGLSKSFGDTVLLQDVDLEVRPGERIGIVGPNGVGKSTLLKLIQGSLPPDRGQIDRTSRATIGLLDQHRSGLDPTDSVIDAAASGNRHVRMGDADVSVQSFLGYFAFPREAFDQQVSALSGGERARLLLARLMIQGHPILLLDEPTNDLDLLTLRVLEESLLDFDGCALIVTHDRAFLDRVCTGILAFEGSGQVVRYASRHQAEAGRPRATPPTKPPKPAPTRAAPRKLSWRERNELDALPGQIEALEQEQARIEAELSRTETYQGDPERLRTLQRRLEALPREIEPLYERWAVLESMT